MYIYYFDQTPCHSSLLLPSNSCQLPLASQLKKGLFVYYPVHAGVLVYKLVLAVTVTMRLYLANTFFLLYTSPTYNSQNLISHSSSVTPESSGEAV